MFDFLNNSFGHALGNFFNNAGVKEAPDIIHRVFYRQALMPKEIDESSLNVKQKNRFIASKREKTEISALSKRLSPQT